jgi:hypothetical protein
VSCITTYVKRSPSLEANSYSATEFHIWENNEIKTISWFWRLCTFSSSQNMSEVVPIMQTYGEADEFLTSALDWSQRSTSRPHRPYRRKQSRHPRLCVYIRFAIIQHWTSWLDRLCGLVVRVPGYRSRGPRFDTRRYQIFWEVVGLKRGPLSLLRIIQELLVRKVAAPVYKTEINNRGDSLRWPRETLYPLKLALTSPTSGGLSVGIVRLRTKAPEFLFLLLADC